MTHLSKLSGLTISLLAGSIAMVSVNANAEEATSIEQIIDERTPQPFTVEDLAGVVVTDDANINAVEDVNDSLDPLAHKLPEEEIAIKAPPAPAPLQEFEPELDLEPLEPSPPPPTMVKPNEESPVSPVNSDGGTDQTSIDSIESSNNPIPSGTKTATLSQYAKAVNSGVWTPGMRKVNTMTVKLQALLDWNHASPGPIDGGWGMNSKKALANFQAMKGLQQTGRMNQATWNALTRNVPKNQPVLVEYTITKADEKTTFQSIPSGYPAKSRLSGMYYNNIQEMFGERFHMSVGYLKQLNPGKKFVAGETITVYNPGKTLNTTITKVVANKKDETLYAYNGNKLVATYPTTVGSSATPSPHGTFRIVNKVKMPWYNATVEEKDGSESKYRIAPGPNNPVGVVWMGLSKPSYGLHGSPVPEGISRQASHGCIRLTNWDVLEVYANIRNGATVELK